MFDIVYIHVYKGVSQVNAMAVKFDVESLTSTSMMAHYIHDISVCIVHSHHECTE